MREKRIAAIVLASVLLVGAVFFGAVKLFTDVATEADVKEAVYTHEYNGLTIEVYEPKVTADADTGKAIARFPVKLTNESDHAFTFRVPHFSYNGNEYVFGILNAEYDDIAGKIARGETKDGWYSITLDTRELSEVKTLNPTLSITDMKSEKEINLTPELITP